jgi:hypothetical protein
MAQQAFGLAPGGMFDPFDGESEQSDLSKEYSSLKDLVEAATGIPAEVQKLVVGRRGPLEDPKRPLYRYDVGHGALLYLSIKSSGSRHDVQNLASPALKQHYNVHQPWECMDEFMKSKASMGSRNAKEVVEPLPDWRFNWAHAPVGEQARSSEMYYQDYTYLRDNHIFDLAGRIRKRFSDLARVAQSRVEAGDCRRDTMMWKAMIEEEKK